MESAVRECERCHKKFPETKLKEKKCFGFHCDDSIYVCPNCDGKPFFCDDCYEYWDNKTK